MKVAIVSKVMRSTSCFDRLIPQCFKGNANRKTSLEFESSFNRGLQAVMAQGRGRQAPVSVELFRMCVWGLCRVVWQKVPTALCGDLGHDGIGLVEDGTKRCFMHLIPVQMWVALHTRSMKSSVHSALSRLHGRPLNEFCERM